MLETQNIVEKYLQEFREVVLLVQKDNLFYEYVKENDVIDLNSFPLIIYSLTNITQSNRINYKPTKKTLEFFIKVYNTTPINTYVLSEKLQEVLSNDGYTIGEQQLIKEDTGFNTTCVAFNVTKSVFISPFIYK